MNLEFISCQQHCDSNIQYGIQAFGEEAIELHKEALTVRTENRGS
jgi:hypothetical protein